MTDTSILAPTHSTADSYPVTAPLNPPAPKGTVADPVPAEEEEEPYTIKCICDFEDDDGNTVFCESCETWQHIECYYHGREVPEIHNCTDCEPRYLDAKRATERQRRLREQSEVGERKGRRSGTKSQKKKTKDHDSHHVNGYHHRSDSSSRDQPAAKKVKTTHKSSASVSSQSGLATGIPDSRKRSGSTMSMSPSKSSTMPNIPLYAKEFLHLYDNDPGHVDMPSNLFVNLTLAGELATWAQDADALARVAKKDSPQEVYTFVDALDCSKGSNLFTQSVTDHATEIDGVHPTWKILKTPIPIRKDEIVGEVKGKIGLLRDYCLDPSNRWQELRHPQPFVFFHPQLPIYIDTREEGSILRYIRRSCRPNVTMKTFITNDVEYHFCFVANQDIPADSEVTAMWYLDPTLFGSPNGLVKQDSGDTDPEAAAICISNVLAHFGGCACNSSASSQTCLLSNVDRRRHPAMKQAANKRKKTKSKPNLSPLGFGGRAGSEGAKNMEEDDADNRSTSGLVRGHTHSRDLTPTQTPAEWGLADTELSAREKRKIAAAEKHFEQLEHEQQTSTKKKKRSSGHSAQATPTTSSSKQAGYFSTPGSQSKSLHVDTNVGRKSNSPPARPSSTTGHRRKVLSPAPVRERPVYVDAGLQVDLDNVPHEKLAVRRTGLFVPLCRRLLQRAHEDRMRAMEKKVSLEPEAVSQPNSVTKDVEMKDADSSTSRDARPSESDMSPSSSSLTDTPGAMGKPPFPLPSTAAHHTVIPAKQRTGLHVQLPTNTSPSTSGGGPVTPGSAQSSSSSSAPPSAQTPGGSITAPSPVKKKLSLGDYISRRGTLASPTTEKTQPQALGSASKPVPSSLSTDSQGSSTTGAGKDIKPGGEGASHPLSPRSVAVTDSGTSHAPSSTST